MKELFISCSIPNFEKIQEELLNAIDHDYTAYSDPYAFGYSQEYMTKNCPLFSAWLLPRLRQPVRLYRYYVTPPHQKLRIHIDGSIPTIPFGLNIPITGTKNTFHNIYECDTSNIVMPNTIDIGRMAALYPKDLSKLRLLESLEITVPHVINTEIMHGVVNDTDFHRVMLALRWMPFKNRSIEECMNTDGMF